MRKSALLIGAETFGLTGARNDVDAMAEQLERRRFGVQSRLGADAARAAILDALERLIRDAQKPDAVVVYFSGHGGLIAPPPALIDRRNPVPRLQFLVPTDYDTTPSDFRGISTAELSVLLAGSPSRRPMWSWSWTPVTPPCAWTRNAARSTRRSCGRRPRIA